MIITEAPAEIRFPENEEEVTKNRKRYVRALRLAKKQCRGALIEKNGKRCAVGVGVALFLGLKTRGALTAAENTRRDVYGEFGRMVGLPTRDVYGGFSVGTIWRLNDSHGKTLREIGDRLAREWDLA